MTGLKQNLAYELPALNPIVCVLHTFVIQYPQYKKENTVTKKPATGEKMCPVLTAAVYASFHKGDPVDCWGARCQWWDDKREDCGVKNNARTIVDQEQSQETKNPGT